MQDLELLSPAGSFETALSAFTAGADAVYLGLDAFSARAEAVNLTAEQLKLLIAYARPLGKKIYVTFNTVLDDANLPAAVDKLALLNELGPDGVIVQDLGVARLIRRYFPNLPLHASTQLVAHNLEGVLALKELGFVRVVLARELSLEEIRAIVRRCGVEIEVFIHGALCYSLSGLCLFSAMEKKRSGNRGRCAYCCRLSYTDGTGHRALPFSMRDLRLDESLEGLRDAGVVSLKIEGRMKSALYVASVTKYYRQLLDNLHLCDTSNRPSAATAAVPPVTRADLETVFSRRTTSLYVRDPKAPPSAVIDSVSLGHLGTPIGTVKRLTKDREGRTWLRFHTTRALEKHDGLQFASEGSKPFGFGITDLRVALARSTVCSVRAGADVEVLVPEDRLEERFKQTNARDTSAERCDPLRPGATVYCSASNEVKRRFPAPSFRPSEIAVGESVDTIVHLAPDGITASVPARSIAVSLPVALTPAQHPERTDAAVRRAFERLGTTDWLLGQLTVEDQDRLFAPPSVLNNVRRLLVERLDTTRIARDAEKTAAVQKALNGEDVSVENAAAPQRVLKIRLDQPLPDDAASYDEVVVAVGHCSGKDAETALSRLAAVDRKNCRLALPVFTHEKDFNALRSTVKHLLRAGYGRWEAADLATLRLLNQVGITDITADWTLYAFNRMALAELREHGVTRCVVSPENERANLAFLASSGCAVEFLDRQSTPLFLSLTKPDVEDPSLLTGLDGTEIVCSEIDGLWVTTRAETRTFSPPDHARTVRTDLSWDL